jgi:gluconolactonase
VTDLIYRRLEVGATFDLHLLRAGLVLLGLLVPLSLPAFFAAPGPGEEPIFAPGARLRVEARGGVKGGPGGEGPAWHPELGLLSTGYGGQIWQLDRTGQSRIYDERTGVCGLLFDPRGQLLACDSGAKQITRTETNGKVVVLTDHYQGKRYNSPNDLTADGRGRIYFSDPRYGDRKGMEMVDEKGQTIEGVYRIDLDGAVTRIIGRELERPNGLLVSADDRFLYVVDNKGDREAGERKLWRFPLREDGTVDFPNRKLIRDWGQARGPDGLKQDQKGRLYVAAGLAWPTAASPDRHLKGGIYVFSPEADWLDFLPLPGETPTNCAFGGDDLKTLFITTMSGALYSIRTTTPGRVVWPTRRGNP